MAGGCYYPTTDVAPAVSLQTRAALDPPAKARVWSARLRYQAAGMLSKSGSGSQWDQGVSVVRASEYPVS